MLGKIKGFKRFLETAEKEQLESLVSQNPTYFYKILPYTYALGVSSKWIKQFEGIALEAPDWYSGTSDFDLHSFSSFLTSTMDSAESSLSSSDGGGGRRFWRWLWWWRPEALGNFRNLKSPLLNF